MEGEEHPQKHDAPLSISLRALQSQMVGYHGTDTSFGKKSRDDPIEKRAGHDRISIADRRMRSCQGSPDDLTEAFR
jgi:hypothetical protein